MLSYNTNDYHTARSYYFIARSAAQGAYETWDLQTISGSILHSLGLNGDRHLRMLVNAVKREKVMMQTLAHIIPFHLRGLMQKCWKIAAGQKFISRWVVDYRLVGVRLWNSDKEKNTFALISLI